MERNRTLLICIIAIVAIVASAKYYYWENGVDPVASSQSTTSPSVNVNALSAPFADLYYQMLDCEGEGRFSSLDVNISTPQPAYRTPLGGVYIPVATSSSDTISASVLRDDGCYNFDEPSEMTTFAAEQAK